MSVWLPRKNKAFEPLEKKIRVSTSRIVIPRSEWEFLGSPKTVDIFERDANGLIRIVRGESRVIHAMKRGNVHVYTRTFQRDFGMKAGVYQIMDYDNVIAFAEDGIVEKVRESDRKEIEELDRVEAEKGKKVVSKAVKAEVAPTPIRDDKREYDAELISGMDDLERKYNGLINEEKERLRKEIEGKDDSERDREWREGLARLTKELGERLSGERKGLAMGLKAKHGVK